MALESVDAWLAREQPDMLWELYHENSKVGRHDRHPLFARRPSDATVVGMMRQLRTVKPYRDSEKVPLPTELPPALEGFDETVRSRATARGFAGTPVSLAELAKVLTFSYGIQRDETADGYPRPFRSVPSGGALYPLELYVHVNRVTGLSPGLHHYDPESQELDVLRPGGAEGLAELMIQPRLVLDAAAVVLVSATFLRTTFKYGERGYRFALLEAGHLGQNFVLTATSLGLAAAPIGGYLDAEVDRYLGFDGISESTVYVLLLGQAP